MNAEEMSRTYGYIRASTDKQIASPETQRQIIEDYAIHRPQRQSLLHRSGYVGQETTA